MQSIVVSNLFVIESKHRKEMSCNAEGGCLCKRTRQELDADKDKRIGDVEDKNHGEIPEDATFPKHRKFISHEDDALGWVCTFCTHPIAVHPASVEPVLRPVGFDAFAQDPIMDVLIRHFGSVDPTSSHSSYPTCVESASFVKKCIICSQVPPVDGYPRAKGTELPRISRAHMLSKRVIGELKSTQFQDDVGNYLPLCGSKGWVGSCHDAFDRHLIMFVYIGAEDVNDGKYMILAADEYAHLNEQVVHLPPSIRRRVLQAHALVVLSNRQVKVSREIEHIVKVKRWSPEAKKPNEECQPSTVSPQKVHRFTSGTDSSVEATSHPREKPVPPVLPKITKMHTCKKAGCNKKVKAPNMICQRCWEGK